MSDDLQTLLATLGRPLSLFRRLNEVRRKQDDEDEDEDVVDWDFDEEAPPEVDAIAAGFRFASAAAAALRDTTAFAWVAWACAFVDEEEVERTDGPALSARLLRLALERRAERDGVASLAGPTAKLGAHPHPRVRAALAGALAALGEVPAALVHDPDPDVRRAARRLGDAPGTGLLPIDAPPALSEALADLDPAHLAVIDPPRRDPAAWGPVAPAAPLPDALSALPDALALVVLPRLLSTDTVPTSRDRSVLRALFARPGGLDAFLAQLPRLAAGDACEPLWEHQVTESLAPVATPAMIERLLTAIEAELPPAGTRVDDFHAGRMLARMVEALAPTEVAPICALLDRAGPPPDDYGVRWSILSSLRRAAAREEAPR